MYSFMDDNLIVTDKTLIEYTGHKSQIVIPATAEKGRIIETIGMGAISDRKCEEIIVSEGIKEINEKAIWKCSQLKNVVFPTTVDKVAYESICECDGFGTLSIKRIVSEADYMHIKANSIKADNEYLILDKGIDDSIGILNLVSSNISRTITDLSQGTNLIFIDHGEYGKDNREARSVCAKESMGKFIDETTETRPCFSFESGMMNMSEEICVANMISRYEETRIKGNGEAFTNAAYDSISDDFNDWLVKTDSKRNIFSRGICILNDVLTERIGDKRHIVINVYIGRLFVPHITRVKISGKEYFIYSRYYMINNASSAKLEENSIEEYVYLRRDMGVYTSEGVVSDIQVVNEVYAKFMLVSML